MPRTGRPKSGNAREKIIMVRVDDAEHAVLGNAATIETAKRGKPVSISEYVRDAAVAKAKRAK